MLLPFVTCSLLLFAVLYIRQKKRYQHGLLQLHGQQPFFTCNSDPGLNSSQLHWSLKRTSGWAMLKAFIPSTILTLYFEKTTNFPLGFRDLWSLQQVIPLTFLGTVNAGGTSFHPNKN